MQLKNIFENITSNSGERAEWIWDKIKNDKIKYAKAHKIIQDWYDELISKFGNGMTIHKKRSHLQQLFSFIDLYIISKQKDDKNTLDYASKKYNKIAQQIAQRIRKLGTKL